MEKLDTIRATTLKRIDAAERHFRLAFIGAGAVEAVLLAAMLLIADLSNRTHQLVLVGTILSYSVVVAGLFALGAHVNRTALRIVQAIEAER
jgi:Kef-type K+ transport system membrane component KefB